MERRLEVVAKSVVRPNPVVPEGVQRVMKECTSLKLSASLIEVDPAYYTWTLQERWYVYSASVGVALMGRGLTGRSAHLNAPSVHHLCKSILLENTASTKVRSAYAYTGRVSCVRDDATDRTKRHGYVDLLTPPFPPAD